jgi:hypothetical protein
MKFLIIKKIEIKNYKKLESTLNFLIKTDLKNLKYYVLENSWK